MCGIAGIFSFEDPIVEPEIIEKMTRILAHRGPDDEAYFFQESVAFGFRRLSIIDLSHGRQPLTNEDGTVCLVANGEIYNFRELRSELIRLGHLFVTGSDCEVIVHGYEEWGEEVVHKLNGMFAFAIWDRQRQKLMLARDHFGIKPLFYSRQQGYFAFASEMKSLRILPEVGQRINNGAVVDYFAGLYIPDPETIYEDIHQLQPGSLMTVQNTIAQARRYWAPGIDVTVGRTLEDWCSELRHLIEQSVLRQMTGDVPIGVFLSGGLDSSAIVAALSRQRTKDLKTFSIGFDVPAFDETRYAAMVSRKFNTLHRTELLSVQSLEALSEVLWYVDEPLADPTIIPMYLLSRMTRKDVTVALSGEGGDELFAGYTHYQGMRLNEWLAIVPHWMRRFLAAALHGFPAPKPFAVGSGWHRLERVLESSLHPAYEGYLRKVTVFSHEEQQNLFAPEFLHRIGNLPHLGALRSVPEKLNGKNTIAQACLADLSVYLPGDLLKKADRTSMAASLEVRVPFLDIELVRFAQTVPIELKLKGLQTKYLLRETIAEWLPREIVYRRKRGFLPPINLWLYRNLHKFSSDHAIKNILRESGYFNMAYIDAMYHAHVSGRRDYSRQIWSLIVFATWFRNHIERKASPCVW